MNIEVYVEWAGMTDQDRDAVDIDPETLHGYAGYLAEPYARSYGINFVISISPIFSMPVSIGTYPMVGSSPSSSVPSTRIGRMYSLPFSSRARAWALRASWLVHLRA